MRTAAPRLGVPLHPDPAYLERIRPLLEGGVDFVEVSPETLWGPRMEGPQRCFRELRERSGLPFVAHGLGFSLGSEDAAHQADWLRRIERDHAEFEFEWYSERLGLVEADGVHATLPLPLPTTPEAVDVVARNLTRLADVVPQVAFENWAGMFSLGDPLCDPAFRPEPTARRPRPSTPAGPPHDRTEPAARGCVPLPVAPPDGLPSFSGTPRPSDDPGLRLAHPPERREAVSSGPPRALAAVRGALLGVLLRRPLPAPSSEAHSSGADPDRTPPMVRLLRRLPLLAFALCSSLPAAARQDELAELEAFVLSDDRESVLAGGLPDDPTLRRLRCLHHLHVGSFDALDAELDAWRAEAPDDPALARLLARRAIAGFEVDPDRAWRFLDERFPLGGAGRGFRGEAGARGPSGADALPSRVAPGTFTAARFLEASRAGDGAWTRTLDEAASWSLSWSGLTESERDGALDALEQADAPGAFAAIRADLDRARDFGSRPVHGALLRAQLDRLSDDHPDLLEREAFVAAYLARLAPNADVDAGVPGPARGRWLDELTAFTERLPERWDGLRARVLHHRLRNDRALGQVSEETFRAYLEVADASAISSALHAADGRRVRREAELGEELDSGLEPIRTAEHHALVRELLLEFLAGRESTDPYPRWLDADHLDRTWVEAQLLAGRAPGPWLDRVDDPAFLDAIERRVELRFPPEARTSFAATDTLALDLVRKGVRELYVTVHEVDAEAWFRERGRAVPLGLDLSGNRPLRARRLTFDDSPFVRERERIAFPDLRGPGVFAVRIAGGGRVSDVLVRMGDLTIETEPTIAGRLVRAFDERGRAVADAELVVGGRTFAAGPGGEILVPFAGPEVSSEALVRGAGRVARAELPPLGEDFGLELRAWMDLEQRLADREGVLLVRPRLTLAGRTQSPVWLEDPAIVVTGVGTDGSELAFRVEDLDLSDAREGVVEVPVPAVATRWTVRCEGVLPSVLSDEPIRLRSNDVTLEPPAIHDGERLAAPLLGRGPAGYVLDLLGRGGEPVADAELELEGRHRFLPGTVTARVRTDGAGRVELGPLEDVDRLRVRGDAFGVLEFDLAPARCSWPDVLHLEQGQAFGLPVSPALAEARPAVSLLELRGSTPVADRAGALAFEPGRIACAGLEPGDYRLWLPVAGQRVDIRVTRRRAADGSIEAARRLEPIDPPALAISGASLTDAGRLVVELAGAGERTRVHVVASRYAPSDRIADRLALPSDAAPDPRPMSPPRTEYAEDGRLDPEERYVLERRFATKFAGSLLDRPGLLLDPWVDERDVLEEFEIGGGAGGGGGRVGGRRSTRARSLTPPGPGPGSGPAFADRGFLPEPAVVRANLVPDADGRVALDAATFGGRGWIEVCAVDGAQTVTARLFDEPDDFEPRDLTVAVADGSTGPSLVSFEARVLRAGDPLPEGPPGPERWIPVRTLGDAFELLRGACPDPVLAEFAFVKDWDTLELASKEALYGRYACHELNLFLRAKDPAFFDSVVRPYLANVLQPTFLDDWLLGRDVRRWAEPAAFARLGPIEQVLLLDTLDPAAFAAWRTERRARARRTREEREAPIRAALRSGWADPRRRAELERLAGSRGDGSTSERAPAPAEETDDFARRSLRERARVFESAPGDTRTWVETRWWRRPLDAGPPPVAGPDFWLDHAGRDRSAPFLSERFLEATGGSAEVLAALALLDLPFRSAPVEEARGDGSPAALPAGAGPWVVLERRRVPVEPSDDPAELLLVQEFFDAAGRGSDGARRAAPREPDELEPGRVVGLRWIVTNPSPRELEVELAPELPEGAIPVDGRGRTRSRTLRLAPWGQELLAARVYFPRAGGFRLPSTAAVSEGRAIATFDELALDVRPRSVPRALTLADVARAGDADAIVAFLAERPTLEGVDWSALEARFREPEVWRAVLEHVEARAGLVDAVWRPAILHRDVARTAEFLTLHRDLAEQVGPYVESPLLAVDPFDDLGLEHLEFAPLHLARAHSVGGRRLVAHEGLAAERERLLWELAHAPRLDATARLRLTDLFLATGRIADAIEQFGRVDPAAPVARLQRDYLACWLALVREDLPAARAAAAPHRGHPVPRWRERFDAAWSVIERAEGGAGGADPREVGVEAAPVLELTAVEGALELRHRGRRPLVIGFYGIDLESRFSDAPFAGGSTAEVPFARPERELRLPPSDELATIRVPIPAELDDAPLTVVARQGALSRQVQVRPTRLRVDVAEASGRLTVADERHDRPVSRVYVKVYRREPGGAVHFHKDGYTDVLGRFDYASVTPPARAERFAILVLDETRGAVLREVRTPGS